MATIKGFGNAAPGPDHEDHLIREQHLSLPAKRPDASSRRHQPSGSLR